MDVVEVAMHGVAMSRMPDYPLVFTPLRAASKPRRLRPATPGFECALYRFVTRYFLVLARGECRPEAIFNRRSEGGWEAMPTSTGKRGGKEGEEERDGGSEGWFECGG